MDSFEEISLFLSKFDAVTQRASVKIVMPQKKRELTESASVVLEEPFKLAEPKKKKSKPKKEQSVEELYAKLMDLKKSFVPLKIFQVPQENEMALLYLQQLNTKIVRGKILAGFLIQEIFNANSHLLSLRDVFAHVAKTTGVPNPKDNFWLQACYAAFKIVRELPLLIHYKGSFDKISKNIKKLPPLVEASAHANEFKMLPNPPAITREWILGGF